MSAYVIFTREKLINKSELNLYVEKAPAGFVGHPVKILASHTKFEVIEGPNVESVVLLEFPSLQEAKAWYTGEAYKEALAHRMKAAEYRCVMEGV